jgi:hypothetical protein
LLKLIHSYGNEGKLDGASLAAAAAESANGEPSGGDVGASDTSPPPVLLSGEIFKHSSMRTAYFHQNQQDCLPYAQSPLEYLGSVAPSGSSEQVLRAHLGSFGLSGELALQQIGKLSGGQKTRVVLAALTIHRYHRNACAALCFVCCCLWCSVLSMFSLVLCRHLSMHMSLFKSVSLFAWLIFPLSSFFSPFHRPHLLLLDEPTNNLDLDSIRAMREALEQYAGACIVASHDMSFVKATCPEVYHIAKGRLLRLEGGVDEFKELVAKSVAAQRKAST